MAPAPANPPVTLGVDVGGTKVAAALIEDAKPVHRVEHPTDVSSGDAVIAGIEGAAKEVIERCGATPAAIGVGVPSQIDFASKTVVASVNIPLAGVALGQELENRLQIPVFVDNDANCAALAEAEHHDAQYLVMYTLGTGVGGGLVNNGRIFRGHTGLGAELGHAVIQYDGPPCPGTCPNRGCLEALCSGMAVERDGAALAKDYPDSALGQAARRNGGAIKGHDVVAAAENGDEHAVKLFENLGTLLGVGLSGAINTFEPEHIVIGGGLSRASHLFLQHAIDEARARALPALAERVEIGVAKAGPDAGVIGAGLLALHEVVSGDTAGTTATEGVR